MQSGKIIIQEAQRMIGLQYAENLVILHCQMVNIIITFLNVFSQFLPIFIVISQVFTSVLDTDLLSVSFACSMRIKPVLRRWQVLLLRLDTDYPQTSANDCRWTDAHARMFASADACFALDFIVTLWDWTELNWFY